MVSFWEPLWTVYDSPAYNCSVFPSARVHEKQIAFGCWSIVFGFFCELLYIPCITAIATELHQSCYKIMFFLSIIDMCTLWVNSISFGYLPIEGGDFCTHFSFNLWNGALGLGLWCVACGGCFLLGLNRIMELLNHSHIFEDRRTEAFLVFPVLYGLYYFLFTPPVLFNSHHQAMFFSPFIYGGTEYFSEYVNWPHTVNNLLVVFLNVSLSFIFCLVMVTKQGMMKTDTGKAKLRTNMPIYLQCGVVCIFHVIGGIIVHSRQPDGVCVLGISNMSTVYMNFFPTPPVLAPIGHISWQFIHGAPPMVYIIALNRTIRRRVQRFIPFCRKCKNNGSKASPLAQGIFSTQ